MQRAQLITDIRAPRGRVTNYNRPVRRAPSLPQKPKMQVVETVVMQIEDDIASRELVMPPPKLTSDVVTGRRPSSHRPALPRQSRSAVLARPAMHIRPGRPKFWQRHKDKLLPVTSVMVALGVFVGVVYFKYFL